MDTNQIYTIVNSVNKQAFGTDALTVVDNTSLVAMGNTVLSSSTNTEAFMNTLVQRIGKTIVSYRMYRSKFSGLLKDDFEMGAILQKLKVQMPEAEEDQSFDLTDGGTVDMYKIAKPKVQQKLFVTRTPYQFHITIQRVHLEEAFLSTSAMGGFISAVFGEVTNAIEVSLENMGRNCLNNYIAEVGATAREVKLLTNYNAETEQTLTADKALMDPNFLRYAVSVINDYSVGMETMSTLYNDGTVKRHTPRDLQKMYVLQKFNSKLRTVVQYDAFNRDDVALPGFETVPFWQDAQAGDVATIHVKRASDSADTTVSNVMATLFDIEALGTYKHKEWTSTTPFNSAGGYANTYWHEQELYFNDLSVNFIVFTLN